MEDEFLNQVAQEVSPEEMEDEETPDVSPEDVAAQDILDAINSADPAMLKEALMTFMELSQSMTEDEEMEDEE